MIRNKDTHKLSAMNRVKKVTVVIEASSTGFGAYSDALPGITGYGKTIDEAKTDLKESLQEVLAAHAEEGSAPDTKLNGGNLEFIYKYDLPSLFEHFGMLDATNFAKHIGLNPSLLRQYKKGIAPISDKQKERIERGLHDLGRELLNVRL